LRNGQQDGQLTVNRNQLVQTLFPNGVPARRLFKTRLTR
jgi:hypothetical protein